VALFLGLSPAVDRAEPLFTSGGFSPLPPIVNQGPDHHQKTKSWLRSSGANLFFFPPETNSRLSLSLSTYAYTQIIDPVLENACPGVATGRGPLASERYFHANWALSTRQASAVLGITAVDGCRTPSQRTELCRLRQGQEPPIAGHPLGTPFGENASHALAA